MNWFESEFDDFDADAQRSDDLSARLSDAVVDFELLSAEDVAGIGL